MKQIEAQIMGQGYLLSCPPEGHEVLVNAVSRVDSAMCKIRDAGKVRTRERIAVLASLNLAVELTELTQQLQQTQANLQAALAAVQPALPAQSGIDGATQLLELSRRLDQALNSPSSNESSVSV